ncbi:uncharacterized protein BDR25DRAFT_356661 [Lindgomyces ingoldianus]|uniref:Uncharacterized protein n=1 Tax=Lindgomyces ingoldianus TaxID=673940 RepID=A0ACB6QTE7_9PLEO|nr:uncharacterized protein BDR25DRAFT_356661 [Lindgomyces ingoldianus]KAF2469431.1 hypothetical protein BDR25DRAFT_356661 [Lindgomyces ingoldianus]
MCRLACWACCKCEAYRTTHRSASITGEADTTLQFTQVLLTTDPDLLFLSKNSITVSLSRPPASSTLGLLRWRGLRDIRHHSNLPESHMHAIARFLQLDAANSLRGSHHTALMAWKGLTWPTPMRKAYAENQWPAKKQSCRRKTFSSSSTAFNIRIPDRFCRQTGLEHQLHKGCLLMLEPRHKAVGLQGVLSLKYEGLSHRSVSEIHLFVFYGHLDSSASSTHHLDRCRNTQRPILAENMSASKCPVQSVSSSHEASPPHTPFVTSNPPHHDYFIHQPPQKVTKVFTDSITSCCSFRADFGLAICALRCSVQLIPFKLRRMANHSHIAEVKRLGIRASQSLPLVPVNGPFTHIGYISLPLDLRQAITCILGKRSTAYHICLASFPSDKQTVLCTAHMEITSPYPNCRQPWFFRPHEILHRAYSLGQSNDALFSFCDSRSIVWRLLPPSRFALPGAGKPVQSSPALSTIIRHENIRTHSDNGGNYDSESHPTLQYFPSFSSPSYYSHS